MYAQERRKTAAAVLVIFFLLGTASTAFGQRMSACLPYEDAVAKLKNSYGEEVIGRGLGKRGATVVELFVGPDASWTVLVTRTNGMSCVAASGSDWSVVLPQIGDPA